MRAMPESTLADPQQIIADLQRKLAECSDERDQALAERDKTRRKLAERTVERDEALEQQTAAAEVLQVINASPGNLGPVFDTVCKTAARLCRAEAALISSREGEAYRVVATRSFLPDFVGRLFADQAQCLGGWGLRVTSFISSISLMIRSLL